MFEYFLEVYNEKIKKASGNKAEFEKNDKAELMLLLIMLGAFFGLIISVIRHRYCDIEEAATCTLIFTGLIIVLGVATEVYRRKFKYKKYEGQKRELYKKRNIDTLIETLNSLGYTGKEGIEWVIYHCEEYKEHCDLFRAGRFFKNLSLAVVLPVTGFAAGALISFEDGGMLIDIIEWGFTGAFLIVVSGIFVFLFNDNRHRRYLDLKANLRYIQARPELMAQLQGREHISLLSIGFPGNCNEAINFYKDVLGAKIKEITHPSDDSSDSDSDISSDFVTYSEVVINGASIMMVDGVETAMPGEHFWFTLSFDSKEEATIIFNKLADGGQIIEPLAPQDCVSLIGNVKDQFGITWNIGTKS